jgi:hypothetical protein
MMIWTRLFEVQTAQRQVHISRSDFFVFELCRLSGGEIRPTSKYYLVLSLLEPATQPPRRYASSWPGLTLTELFPSM